MRRDLIIVTAAGASGAAAAAWLVRRRRRGMALPPAPVAEITGRDGSGTPAPAEAVLERTGPLGDPAGDGLAPAPDDGVLTDRVRSALGHHPLGAHVNVNVEFGTVVLRGEVPGDDHIVDLGAAAEAVDGVSRVDNRLHRHGAAPPLGDPTG